MDRGHLSGSRSAALAPRAGSKAWGALRNRTPILVRVSWNTQLGDLFQLPAYIPAAVFVNNLFTDAQDSLLVFRLQGRFRADHKPPIVFWKNVNSKVACINASSSNLFTIPRGTTRRHDVAPKHNSSQPLSNPFSGRGSDLIYDSRNEIPYTHTYVR